LGATGTPNSRNNVNQAGASEEITQNSAKKPNGHSTDYEQRSNICKGRKTSSNQSGKTPSSKDTTAQKTVIIAGDSILVQDV
jgi:hypothetical protein